VKGELGFGIAAAARPGTERLGPAIERLGYAELWANDTRRGAALETLATAGSGTTALRFGVGVIALSEHAPERILAALDGAVDAGLDPNRVTLGVGSGASRSLDLVRAGVAELRRLLPDQRIAVAALGPRMCALAGEVADTVLLNWALPETLVRQRGWVASGAARAGRRPPRVTAYVRVAVGSGAADRLRGEMDRYAGHSDAYASLFADQGGPVGVAVGDPAQLRPALLPYRSILDCCVVRALPDGDDIDAWLAVAEAAAG
jgi:alkanesulfonate monooxygenase SsuD/methylene tetrahydromethanopterin reductase-like flavin-dependent oxidoreductase (luciferase family)